MTAAIADYQDLIASNPHTGTPEQVVTICMGIATAHEQLDRDSFKQLRDWADAEREINEKVFSKLKVIGKTLKKIPPSDFEDIRKKLPQSYSAIHVLCSLKPEELVRAVKSGKIDSKLSVRSAEAYVKQIRYGALPPQEKSIKKDLDQLEIIYGIYRYKTQALDSETKEKLKTDLETICQQYGVEVRVIENQSMTHLKQQNRIKKECFWREVLEEEVTDAWFQSISKVLKKQFNLKSKDEFIHAPLRSFTGLIMKAEGSRKLFWDHHGKTYVAKLCLEQEKTEDRVQRHNLKRRLEEVMAEQKDLAVWVNTRIKEVGFD